MIDPFGRRITYLRVSVTDRCDFRCVYCMAEDTAFLPRKDLLTLEEIDRLASAFIAKGVRKLRLTGGEPLVRKNLIWLIDSLSRHLGDGLDELTLTTNGSQLAPMPSELAACGVARINVSLDTLDRASSRPSPAGAISRKSWPASTRPSAPASRSRSTRWRSEASTRTRSRRCSAWRMAAGFDLTLIETMPMGETGADRTEQYLPLTLVRARLAGALHARRTSPIDSGGPARYVRVRETGGRLGFITPMTHNFCESLQSRAGHLHRHSIYVPRPGGRRRSARAPSGERGRPSAACGDRCGNRGQAQGP